MQKKIVNSSHPSSEKHSTSVFGQKMVGKSLFSFTVLFFYIFIIEMPLSMFISPTPTQPAPSFPQFLQLFIINQ